MKTVKLVSEEDKSVNFILPNGQETRYVRRSDEYFIVYLSSHNGCNKACRFCHLTQTKQTNFVEATYDEIVEQAKLVLDHYKNQINEKKEVPANRINFNWMARGEPLSSSVVRKQWGLITTELVRLAGLLGITNCKFNISSIFPDGSMLYINEALSTTFTGENKPVFYYSLYSLNENWRKRWIPKAVDPILALIKLAKWQRITDGKIVLHWAFIEDENDSEQEVSKIVNLVRKMEIRAKFNLVRYNPFSDNQGKESSEEVILERFEQISKAMNVSGSRIVPRVGRDVYASCGTFFNASDECIKTGS